MNSVTHAAITLLGVYFVISGVGALAGLPDSLAAYDRDSYRFVWVENPGMKLAIQVVAILLFRVAPGALLIRYRSQVVDRVVPRIAQSTGNLRPAEFYVVACVLLAVYFGLTGLVGLVAAIVQAVAWISSAYFFASSLGPLAGALIQVIAAGLLFHHAKARGALLATNPIPGEIAPREHTCGFCGSRFTNLQPSWDQLLKTRRCPSCAEPFDL